MLYSVSGSAGELSEGQESDTAFQPFKGKGRAFGPSPCMKGEMFIFGLYIVRNVVGDEARESGFLLSETASCRH